VQLFKSLLASAPSLIALHKILKREKEAGIGGHYSIHSDRENLHQGCLVENLTLQDGVPLCEEKSTTLLLNLNCAKVSTRKEKTYESPAFIVPCDRLLQIFSYGKNLHKLSTFHECSNLTPSEGPIRRPERGSEWEPIKILLEGD
jgi:hypothetical protein